MNLAVFISSTFVDLKAYRETVRQIVRKVGATDVAMENLGAVDERPLKECLRLVRKESDLFVGIYAHRYGHIPDGSDVSITEAEYLAASEAGLPRLIFLVEENTPWVPQHIDGGAPADLLKSFKSRLKANHVCDFFDSEKDLAARVATALSHHIGLGKLKPVSGEASSKPTKAGKISPKTKVQWSNHRDGVYADSRGVFLVHTLQPSKKKGQLFDILIYLFRHKSEDFSDIKQAEFFLGQYWDNKVFRVPNSGGLVGISTSAYGPFLCTCKVHFTDGQTSLVSRYIDFESSKRAR